MYLLKLVDELKTADYDGSCKGVKKIIEYLGATPYNAYKRAKYSCIAAACFREEKLYDFISNLMIRDSTPAARPKRRRKDQGYKRATGITIGHMEAGKELFREYSCFEEFTFRLRCADRRIAMNGYRESDVENEMQSFVPFVTFFFPFLRRRCRVVDWS